MGGGGRSVKNSDDGKLREKINAHRAEQRKVLTYRKKYSCKGNVKEKNSCGSRFPPPHNFFLMVRPSLNYFSFGAKIQQRMYPSLKGRT